MAIVFWLAAATLVVGILVLCFPKDSWIRTFLEAVFTILVIFLAIALTIWKPDLAYLWFAVTVALIAVVSPESLAKIGASLAALFNALWGGIADGPVGDSITGILLLAMAVMLIDKEEEI